MGTLIVDTIGGRNDNAPNQSDGLTVTGVCSATDFSGLVGGAADFPNGLSATTGGIIVTAGVGTFKGDVELHGNQGVTSVTFDSSANSLIFKDSSYAKFGTGGDLEIYHDGSNSHISDQGSGVVYLRTNNLQVNNAANNEAMISASENGSVDLYYDNSRKLQTISTGASVYGGLRLEGGGFIREHLNIVGTALNSNKVINLSDGMVHYRSAAVGGANVKLNIISNAGVNTDMAIGDIMAVTVITVAGSASHFVDQIRIDGVEASAGVTTNWSGGSAPTDGGSSGIDSYAFNVMKTGNATYVVLANHTKTS